MHFIFKVAKMVYIYPRKNHRATKQSDVLVAFMNNRRNRLLVFSLLCYSPDNADIGFHVVLPLQNLQFHKLSVSIGKRRKHCNQPNILINTLVSFFVVILLELKSLIT